MRLQLVAAVAQDNESRWCPSTLTGHIRPNSACTNRYWKPYFAIGGIDVGPSEHAGAMAHRMQSEFAERDPLHLAIGRMILDPILVAAEAIARMKHRRMLVGDVGKFVEAAAREFAEAIEMRLEMRAQRGLHVKVEQVAKRVDRRGRSSSRGNRARRDRCRTFETRRYCVGLP